MNIKKVKAVIASDLTVTLITEDNFSIPLPNDIMNEIVRQQHTKALEATQDDSDMEEAVDPMGIANAILDGDMPSEDAIQVLEGLDDTKVKLEHFSATNPESYKKLIHFIKENNYQEVKPWSFVWNLHLAIIAVGT